jgi:hypothetical protein
MIKGYVLKISDKIVGDENLKNVFMLLENSKVKKAILFLTDNDALYYRRRDDGVSILIRLPRQNVGASKIYEAKLVRTFKIKSKLSSLDETFALAEEIENMNIEDFIKRKMT